MCDKKFKDFSNLKHHIKTVHDKQRNCEFCDEIFMSFQTLKKHVKLKHDKYYCHQCKKSFKRADALKMHNKTVHEGIRHTCDICGKTYTQGIN